MSQLTMRLAAPVALLLAMGLAACQVPPPTPEGIAHAQALQRQAFLPGAPKPGEPGYDPYACGGDHGMAEQWADDQTGYPRIGPPQMSICP